MSVAPTTLRLVIDSLPRLKTVSLPVCSGCDEDLGKILDFYYGHVSFGHQVLDALSQNVLHRPKFAYLLQ